MHKSKTEQQQQHPAREETFEKKKHSTERERKKFFCVTLARPAAFALMFTFLARKNGWSLTLLLVARGFRRDGAAVAASRHALYR
jgi:hypothetical protein